ncbi:MAG: glycosyltransferase [Gemmatimonadota bacterium]|nr:MAG: glycosyltransferase [Gemmatimonadota bacterium]
MGERPHVSILLPCYNAALTIDQAVDSLLGQTFADFEILAIDDGSTDATASKLRSWAARDKRIVTRTIDRAGIVTALNTAVSTAQGELLVRMDADDISAPTRLEEQVKLLDGLPALAGCGTQMRYFPRDIVRDGARRYEAWINGLTAPAQIERDLFVECPIPHPTLALRRTALAEVGGYREAQWPEDYDLVLRLCTSGHRLGKVPRVLFYWRESVDRLSRTDPRYSDGAFRKCKVHYLAGRISGRPVAICGAGPVGKAFARELTSQGHTVTAFVDLDPRKIGQRIHGAPVVSPARISILADAYFLAAVASEKAREEIRRYLTECGLEETRDFCAVA